MIRAMIYHRFKAIYVLSSRIPTDRSTASDVLRFSVQCVLEAFPSFSQISIASLSYTVYPFLGPSVRFQHPPDTLS